MGTFSHLPCVSPYFNFSDRFDFNVRTLTRPNDTVVVGHDELMMTMGRRGKEVEILTASWRRVRRQSRETSARAWIGVSEQPVQSTVLRARNVIRVARMTHPLPVYDALQFRLPNFIQDIKREVQLRAVFEEAP